LAANTRADIAYAVHQDARFSLDPKNTHALAMERILSYLKKTQDKGMFMHAVGTLVLFIQILAGCLDLKILNILFQSNQELGILKDSNQRVIV